MHRTVRLEGIRSFVLMLERAGLQQLLPRL